MALPDLFRRNRDRNVPAGGGYDPFVTLQDEINRLFDSVWRRSDLARRMDLGEAGTFSPSLDIEESETELTVSAELPGMDEKDLQLDLANDTLTISGEKREEKRDRAKGWFERSYGSFRRTIPLPCDVQSDKVKAHFKKGVLTVHLPKAKSAQEPRHRIPIS